MATISSIGTFTTIPGLVGRSNGNRSASLDKIDMEGLKGVHGVVHDELRQFVQLVADAYALTFWEAAGLVGVLYKALMNSEGPTQQTSYTP